MVLIRRAADTPDQASHPSPDPAEDIPRQAGPGRPGAINVGDIARKPRAVATTLQKLYGI
jgi:hypothetical protein